MKKVTPFLWFDGKAEEAMLFYTSTFKKSKIGEISHNGDAVMSASFELDGQPFIAFNGGPQFTFTPAVSFLINCRTQKEIDYFWDKLTDGGKEGKCGWLTDKFGVSWQVVPASLGTLLGDPNPQKAKRVMDAMLSMDKLIINDLKKALHK